MKSTSGWKPSDGRFIPDEPEYVPVALTHSLHVLFAIICLFYLGSVIAEPARETLSASLADLRMRQLHGLHRLGLAFGGAIGYTGGGWLC